MNLILEDSLGVRGRELWDEVQSRYVLDRHDENILVEVCRVLDVIDALNESIAEHGVMVVGSQGQLVMNSAVGELRQQQTSFARLLPLLNLDSDSAGSALATLTSVRAKQAANARWSKVKAARID